jgi:glucose dehydrogenase
MQSRTFRSPIACSRLITVKQRNLPFSPTLYIGMSYLGAQNTTRGGREYLDAKGDQYRQVCHYYDADNMPRVMTYYGSRLADESDAAYGE